MVSCYVCKSPLKYLINSTNVCVEYCTDCFLLHNETLFLDDIPLGDDPPLSDSMLFDFLGEIIETSMDYESKILCIGYNLTSIREFQYNHHTVVAVPYALTRRYTSQCPSQTFDLVFIINVLENIEDAKALFDTIKPTMKENSNMFVLTRPFDIRSMKFVQDIVRGCKTIWTTNAMLKLCQRSNMVLRNALSIEKWGTVYELTNNPEASMSLVIRTLVNELEDNQYCIETYNKYNDQFTFYKNIVQNTLISFKLAGYHLLTTSSNDTSSSLFDLDFARYQGTNIVNDSVVLVYTSKEFRNVLHHLASVPVQHRVVIMQPFPMNIVNW